MLHTKRAINTIVFLTAFLALFLFSQNPVSVQAEEPPQLSSFLSINAQRTLLDNGLNVIIKKDSRTPTFAVTLLVNTGSATEGAYAGSGITHLIEHMLFKGTTHYTAVQLENELKSLGAEVDAYTSPDYTCFKIEAPSASFKQVLNILADMVANPAFQEEELQREKQVILREIDMGADDPEKYIYKILWQTAYIQHPYRNPVIGYADTLGRLQVSDVTAYFKQFYMPNNMVISVVGDIEPSAALEGIRQGLGSLKRQNFSTPPVAQEPQQISGRQIFQNFPVTQPKILIGFHTVGINNRDLFALDTLSVILGGGLTSRLYKSLHDNKDLVYAIGAYNYTPKHPGLFMVSCLNKKESVEETVKAVIAEIENIKQSFAKDKGGELEKAKAQILNSYLFGLEAQQSKADILAANLALTGDVDFAASYVKGVESVTADDIARVASAYLTEQNMTTAVLLPENTAAKETSAAVVTSAGEMKTIKKNLPNGLTILITENHSLPLCSAIVSIKGALRAEDDKNNGISNLTALMMPKGTNRYKKDQISDIIETSGAEFSPYSGNNSFGFSLDFASKDFDKMVDLLSSIILQPTFPEKELEVVKSDCLADIDLIKEDIFKTTDVLVKNNLFYGHPYGFIPIGTKETVANITAADLGAFHKKYCVGKNTVLSICGDINADKAFEVISSKFKDMSEGEPYQPANIELKKITSHKEIVERMKKKQAVVMIGFRGAGIYNNDRYPLQVLSSLFSGGAGRLYLQIRQKESLAYTLGTFGMTGLDTGAFVFYAATVPQSVDHVKMSMLSQIKQVREGKITENEIVAAKKSLITKHELELQSNGGFAMKTALDELYGLGYDYYLRYADLTNAVSAHDLVSVAKKYFDENKAVAVVVKP